MMNTTDVYQGIDGNNSHDEGNNSGNITILRIPATRNQVLNIFVIVLLMATMVSLGCMMELSKMKAHLIKPKGVAIALLSQFGIMPLTAFCLAKIIKMEPIRAVTVLICGCCPGGSLSNIFAMALQGDMNLSIVMTTCSSITALGLMPLLLYIYSQGFPGLKNSVPYLGIITSLVSTLVPCSVGIAINHYKPNYTPIIQKVTVTILIISAVIVAILTGMYVKNIIWMILTPDVLAASALMPLIGFTLGYLMSAVCKMSSQCSRTISMETGFQNIQLCTAILKVNFPLEVIGPMFLFPLIYVIFQCIEALILTLCFRCYQTLKAPAKDPVSPYGNHEEMKSDQGREGNETCY